jgi:hypothetical protein
MVAARTGRGDEARSLLEEAIPLFQRVGDENCIAICHMILGELDIDADRHHEAADYLNRALDGFSRLGGKLYLAPVLRRIADLAATSGQNQRAATLLGAAEATRESVGGVLSPYERTRMDATLRSIRAALSDGELGRLQKEGAAMSTEEGVHYAQEL